MAALQSEGFLGTLPAAPAVPAAAAEEEEEAPDPALGDVGGLLIGTGVLCGGQNE
ncbi:MAG TPA: hypothetical protein VK970_16810 [Candidatus Methylacidiphilales bacterium]|nr:hypothetical protein [Candidatus Methylacidiphilales bacterium]